MNTQGSVNDYIIPVLKYSAVDYTQDAGILTAAVHAKDNMEVTNAGLWLNLIYSRY